MPSSIGPFLRIHHEKRKGPLCTRIDCHSHPQGWQAPDHIHVRLLEIELTGKIGYLFVLQGRMSKKQRTEVLENLEALDESEPRVLLATASLVGEGFDHPPLNTLILAMPISWEGSLKQYAGRIHRLHTFKLDVHIYDYIDYKNKSVAKMWEKRRRAYASMGYQIVPHQL